MANKNLHAAKKAKSDEFYTQLTDIENELKHYKRHFKDKVVFCNCDDPAESNFWKYFELNFEALKLKKLISTHYEMDKPSYKLELRRAEDGGDLNGDGKINNLDIARTPLKQNGDFRSPECVEILKEADVVVTNPPFSLFREYIAQLIEYKKKFLVIGNKLAATYKEIFPLIKDNKIWWGCTSPGNFLLPSREVTKKVNGLCRWFTNLKHRKRNEELILYETYTPEKYPRYDNYDAINVDEVKKIPKDYRAICGVPITFLDKYNPKQFELIKFRKGDDNRDLCINGKCPHFRILIQLKQ